MISVFSEHTSPRLTYVLDFCFKEKGCEYQIVSDQSAWQNIKSNRINYSDLPLDAELQISRGNFLFEDNIRQEVSLSSDLKLDGVKDNLSVIFYLLSRYEEYLSTERDVHDRFLSENSVLVKLGIQNKPIVDILVKEIWEKLNLDYTNIKKQFECVPSFDIDIAWAYKNRGFVRKIGAAIKGSDSKRRKNVLTGNEKDPYDTFGIIKEIASKLNDSNCFILLGNWAKYDKNINWKNKEYQELIKDLAQFFELGIHPSYNSYLRFDKIKSEINRLGSITGNLVSKSRQHFLRLKFPETYEGLIANGIKEDYTMGYADNIGFRAGTSFSHRFFNLKINKLTELTVFPFCYMDSALKDYLKLNPEEAKKEVLSLINEIRKVGGKLSFVWHNSSVNDEGEWKGWKSVLDETIKESLEQ